MDFSSANKHSTSAGNAGNASPRRTTPPSTPQVPDKENLPTPNNDHPNLRTISKSILHSKMDTHTHNSPSSSRNQSASGSKGPVRVKSRRPDLASRAGQLLNAHQGKSTGKRTASMAEMDDSPSPLKRPRQEVPFVFMKDLTLFDENPGMSQQIFLDIVEAQKRREQFLEEDEGISFLVPSIDPRELFGDGSASGMDAHVGAGSGAEPGDGPYVSIPQEESVFGCLRRDLLIWEGLTKVVLERALQRSGDCTTKLLGDLLHEEDRVDAVEAPTDCETDGLLQPPAPLPTIEGPSLSEADVNLDPTLIPSGSTLEPQTTSIPPLMTQAHPEAVHKVSHLPKANVTGPTGGKERSGVQRTARAGSNGIVGTGVAGPSSTTASTPFAYTKAQAKEIWEHACAKDYLGAHALFDPREQVVIINGKEKVLEYLDAHPEMEARLREPNSGKPRESLYVCGASAIWRPKGNPGKPKYELSYEPCHDCGYASMDNYKKHVYRHHLNKVYKQYSKK